jgi:predicted Zn-dependent protease
LNKRLEMLEKLTSSGKADSFAWYALALEYRKDGRIADALAAFRTLRENDAEYLPMYLMAGSTLLDDERAAEAAEWLEQGVALAARKGDGKALGELQDALARARG